MNGAASLPAVGARFAGGIFAGRFFLGDLAYALVVSPKPAGEHKRTSWGPRTAVADAYDPEDGLANTIAMARAGRELGCWARDLRIESYDDWYLPSRLELFVAWLALRDTKEFARDWYWTSTQYAGLDEYAWIQHFTSGYQSSYLKDYECRARAVRRVLIRSFDHSPISDAA